MSENLIKYIVTAPSYINGSLLKFGDEVELPSSVKAGSNLKRVDSESKDKKTGAADLKKAK